MPLSVALVVCALGGRAAAQDKVVLQLPTSSTTRTLSGQVLDYNGRKLTLRTVTGSSERVYPAEQVVEVRTAHVEPHQRGLRAYSDGRIDDAQAAFRDAHKVEPRAWVKREIRAMLIRCALRKNERPSARYQFVELFKRDSQTRYFHLIPLDWVTRDVSEADRRDAEIWMRRRGEVERLMGASTLLSVPQQGEAARSEIRQLTIAGDSRVRILAQMQLWRIRLATEEITAAELDRWPRRIAAMPAELRGGAYFLLGRARVLRQEYEQAAAAWLRLPLVHKDDYHLAARASWEAAAALKQIGQHDEAVTIYREIVLRFGDSTYAADADDALTSFESPRTP